MEQKFCWQLVALLNHSGHCMLSIRNRKFSWWWRSTESAIWLVGKRNWLWWMWMILMPMNQRDTPSWKFTPRNPSMQNPHCHYWSTISSLQCKQEMPFINQLSCHHFRIHCSLIKIANSLHKFSLGFHRILKWSQWIKKGKIPFISYEFRKSHKISYKLLESLKNAILIAFAD